MTVGRICVDWDKMLCYQVPLLAFFIGQRNLAELKNCLSDTDGRMLIEPVGIDPKYFGINLSVKPARKYNVLDLVLATQWGQGVDLLFTHAARLVQSRADGMSLIYAITSGNLQILKLLLARQVLLSIQYRDWELNRFEYPLITALREEEGGDSNTISSYIIEEIGKKVAVEQILEEIQNPESDDNLDFLIELRKRLIKEMQEDEESAEETDKLPPQVTQTPLEQIFRGEN